MKYRYDLIPTAMGWVGILASPIGIRRLAFPQPTPLTALEYLELSKYIEPPESAPGAFPDLGRRLEQYFLGNFVSFPDALDVEGTEFQKQTWEVARSIPWGETRSYGWIAQNIGRPRAARAVGQAMRSNPVPVIVPCHRVIGNDGRMCGYGGPQGVDLKRQLLDMERAWGHSQ